MSIVAPEPQAAQTPELTAPPQQVTAPPQVAAPPQLIVPPQAVAIPAGPRPSISANRKFLVKRFASLAFNVSSGGLPYWEVLLFTDRALIDPANAGRRTPANFYSSRHDGGLRLAPPGGTDVFLVPSAVLRGFAAATPRPTAIYYTVATYASPDGGSPVLPTSPEQLVLTAPSVGVSSDFTPDAVGHLLGVPATRLKVVAQALDTASVTVTPAPEQTPAAAPVAGAITPAPAPAPVAAAPAPAVDPAEDAGAGEDAYSFYAAHPELVGAEPAPVVAVAGPMQPVQAVQAPPPAQPPQPPQAAQAPQPGQPVQPAPGAVAPQPLPAVDEPYDDGYGGYDDGYAGSNFDQATAASWTGGSASPFSTTRPEPAPLGRADAADWAVEEEELDGVAPWFPYRGLDEPAAEPGANGSVVPVDVAPAVDAAPAPPASPAAPPVQRPLALTIDDKLRIIEKIAGSESGTDRYGAINADGEFKGRFGPNHSAYRHHHIGLSYGIIQFTQESGNLGRLLVMMRDRDPATFAQIFGADAATLVDVTTAAGPPSSESPDGRSARTQPVGGADLWEEPWIGRFRQAGNVPAFQAAQNELAASAFVDPMLSFAGDLGLDTDRALAMAVDRAVQMGVTGARHWIVAAVGPISTPALRQQALTAAGFSDVASFQRTYGLEPDNLWGPVTHAALVGALRQLGSGSPIALPTVDQMLEGIVRRAEGDDVFWAGRVKRMRGAGGFTDQPYAR